MTNILSDLRRLTEAVHAAGADIAPTYREYVQLAFAIATDCGEAGRSDFLMLCSLSAKYDVHAANKLFSNALKTNNNSVHIGTAFHLAELCNVRPRPAEKPWQDAPAGTLGTPGAPYPAASHTHAHGYYNRAEMPAEEFPEAPAASLPAEAADAGTACSGTTNAGTTYPGTTYPEAADPEAADEETCRGSEPLTPLPCFDNRTLWPAPLNEITAHGTTRAQQDIMLLGAVTVLGASMNSHVRCAYGGKMISPSLQTFIVALPASGKGVLSLVRLLVEPIHDEIRLHTAEAMKQYRKEKGAYDSLGKERSQATPPSLPPDRMFLISGNNTGTGILQNIMDSEGIGLICESEADTISTAIGSEHGHWSDTMRKAFDHDRLSYNRRTDREYREVKRSYLSVLLSGTPAQVKPLIPTAENGLFSRQLFYYMPAIHKWQNQFDRQDTDLETVFTGLGMQWREQLKRITAGGLFTLRLTPRTEGAVQQPLRQPLHPLPPCQRQRNGEQRSPPCHQHLPHHAGSGHAPRARIGRHRPLAPPHPRQGHLRRQPQGRHHHPLGHDHPPRRLQLRAGAYRKPLPPRHAHPLLPARNRNQPPEQRRPRRPAAKHGKGVYPLRLPAAGRSNGH